MDKHHYKVSLKWDEGRIGKMEADGVIEKVDGKFLMTEIILKAKLEIKEEDKKDRAKRILEKSEAACLISNSIKTEVKLESEISIVS